MDKGMMMMMMMDFKLSISHQRQELIKFVDLMQGRILVQHGRDVNLAVCICRLCQGRLGIVERLCRRKPHRQQRVSLPRLIFPLLLRQKID